MLVYVVRHAFAGQHGDPRYPDDSLRPLTKKGRKQFRRLVKQLIQHGFQADLVATSPLVRCRQTADILIEELPQEAGLVELSELAPGSELSSLISWTNQQDAESVAWVGHAPDVDRLTSGLIGKSSGGIRFAKGAIAAVSFDGQAAPGHGELKWLVTPKLFS